MPLSGKITETNKQLLKEPALVNLDSFNNGWLIKIEIQDSNEITKLFTPEQYAQLTGN